MASALTPGPMSPELLKVAERAKREPEGVFHSLAHLLDVPALRRAYDRARKDAAVGVDSMTKKQYGQDLQRNLEDLHERLKSKRYRHQPILRVRIPKEKGKTRPIGISAFEDKVVQEAVRQVLEASPLTKNGPPVLAKNGPPGGATWRAPRGRTSTVAPISHESC